MRSKEFEPGYIVYYDGTIWSNKTSRFLRPFMNNKGYMRVDIYNGNNKRTRYFVHRIVCEAFHVKVLNKKQVNHKDWDRSNNHGDNMEWCSARDNVKHARDRPKPKAKKYVHVPDPVCGF